MSEDGSYISATATSTADYISPCYGVVVQAEGASESVTFSTTPLTQQSTSNNGNLNIALSQAVEPAAPSLRGTKQSSILDNAIVTFNEGSELGKFYFGNQNANIYIPQDNKDYAIAYSNGIGEVPLNFKANRDSEYTITVAPENVEMSYLHLIDNMTGADVDLLGSSSYTFTAKTTDYASRFRLVFVAKGENGPSTGSVADEPFAFCANGDWIILNPSTSSGTATLQVIDLLGRQIYTREAIPHSEFRIPHAWRVCIALDQWKGY